MISQRVKKSKSFFLKDIILINLVCNEYKHYVKNHITKVYSHNNSFKLCLMHICMYLNFAFQLFSLSKKCPLNFCINFT